MLTGGDTEWDCCLCELRVHDDLPIVLAYEKNGGMIEGLKIIEEIISKNTKYVSLGDYLEKVSEVFSGIVEQQ